MSASDLTVALDYGQFTLETGPVDPELGVELLEVALAVGVAQRDQLVLVLSPHQNNFAMPLRVELWTGEPGSDLDDWEEVVEAHLDVGEHGLTYGSPTMDYEPLPVGSGSYRALITGRGFVGRGWPGSTEPGDSWRIRLWPSTERIEARRLKSFSKSTDADEESLPGWSRHTPHETQGRASAHRICADLDQTPNARTRSGSQGTLTVEHLFPYSRRRVFKYFREPWSWLTWSGHSLTATQDAELQGYFLLEHGWSDERRADDEVLGTDGTILGQWLDINSPGAVSFHWVWRRSAERPDSVSDRPTWLEWQLQIPAAAPTSVVCVALSGTKIEHVAHTRVALTHEALPTEWVADMTDWWAWQLERCERIISIN